MAITSEQNTSAPHDGFEAFYTEKVWALIPGIYRDEDTKSKTPGALRAFVEILATQAASQRRSIDRLWADSHITDCDDWVIPYIADLLATRLISEQNTAGRRADVANTISYRRRSGTLHLMEQLANDIGGWDAVASEAFKRLYRNWHIHDCPTNFGPITKTPQGGYANIKPYRICDTINSTFDDVAHFPDFRQFRGQKGRYNIPKINLHIYRQVALPVLKSSLHKFLDEDNPSNDLRQYAFDPSGRDIPLFMTGLNIHDNCRSARPWEVRAPLSCGLLNTAQYIPTQPPSLANQVFENDDYLIQRIESSTGNVMSGSTARGELNAAIVPESAKNYLLNEIVSLAIMPPLNPELSKLSPASIAGGNLKEWETFISTPGKWIRAVIDPARGRIWLPKALNVGKSLECLRYHYGQFYPIGAGTYDRRAHVVTAAFTPVTGSPTSLRLPGTVPTPPVPDGHGLHQFTNSLTYHHDKALKRLIVSPPDPNDNPLTDLTIQAGNGERPYIVLTTDTAQKRWEIKAAGSGRTLVLDGLWLALIPDNHGSESQANPPPVETELVLKGDFKHVTLRHMTLDPGGERAVTKPGKTFVLPYVKLKIEGQVEQLDIQRCITGPIEENNTNGQQCIPTRINIQDSIIVSPNESPAIFTRTASLNMQRSTVFGDVKVSQASISDCLIQGVVQVVNTQGSCFRYSAAPSYPRAQDPDKPRIPQQYKSFVTENAIPNHIFISRRFGDPGFAQLSESAAEDIRRGAENSGEMGAFNCALDPIKQDDLIYKLTEFTSINITPQLIMET